MRGVERNRRTVPAAELRLDRPSLAGACRSDRARRATSWHPRARGVSPQAELTPNFGSGALDHIRIQLSPVALEMQVVDIEERGFLERLEVGDREFLAAQDDQVLSPQFLQSTIDVNGG